MHRHLWPGLSVRDTSAKGVNETLSEVMITRGMLPESMGSVHWSISSLTKNKNISKALLNGPYIKDALVPSSPWLSDKVPRKPIVQITINYDQVHISWMQPEEKDVFRWVVYYQYGITWTYKILSRNARSLNLPHYLQEKAG
jgi:hypothetical protein